MSAALSSVAGFLELKLQCELDRARSANLIQRVETAAGATGAQAVRQCLRRAAEEGTGQNIDRVSEVRMVEDVEELSSEAKPYFFREVKLSLRR